MLAAAALAVLPVADAAASTAPAPAPAPTEAAPRAATSTAVRAVRLLPETRGKGRSLRVVTRVDAFSPDGVRRRVATVPGGASVQRPTISPDGRSVAFAQPDGRIAVVALRGGALRLLRPRGLPKPRPANTAFDPTRLQVVEGAAVSWSPDARVVVAHGLLRRSPERWASTLEEARTVACTVSTRRCTSTGPGAPADLLPLTGGRTLRLDGPMPSEDRVGDTGQGLGSRRQERLVLSRLREPVRTTVSLTATALGSGDRRVLSTTRASTGTGVVALGPRVSGPAGVLLRRTSITFAPDDSTGGIPSSDPTISVRAKALPTTLITPGGRLRTLPGRLGVTPIGSLPDGRWLLPTTQARPEDGLDRPEPGLATLDGRGRVRALRVGGQVVTPVRLALASGLPDTFAVGATFSAAWSDGDDLLVELRDTGADGIFYYPGDAALLRVPLDGASPPRIVDQEGGASYDVR